MKKNVRISFLTGLIVFLVILLSNVGTRVASAAITDYETSGTGPKSEYTLLEPLPCIPSAETPCASPMKKTIQIQEYVNYVFRLAIALAAFLAVFMFTVGGFQYMTSEAMGGKDEAKSRMRNAVFGLLAALASYIILYTIDPRLVQINANIPDLKVAKQDIFGNLDSSLQAIQNRLDEIRRGSIEAIQRRDLLISQGAQARLEAESLQAELDELTIGRDELLDDEDLELEDNIRAYQQEIAGLLETANKADDMAKIVTWQQSVKDDYLRALNSSEIAEIRRLQTRIIDNYTSKITGELHNPADPVVSEMLNKEFIPEKNFELNSLQNYIQQLTVTQASYSSKIALEKAKTDAIGIINSQTNADIARTTDPALKAKYKADAKVQIDTINAFSPTISTPSDYSGIY